MLSSDIGKNVRNYSLVLVDLKTERAQKLTLQNMISDGSDKLCIRFLKGRLPVSMLFGELRYLVLVVVS